MIERAKAWAALNKSEPAAAALLASGGGGDIALVQGFLAVLQQQSLAAQGTANKAEEGEEVVEAACESVVGEETMPLAAREEGEEAVVATQYNCKLSLDAA